MRDLKDKKIFDMEYSTQVKSEMEYLKSCGIKYTFVKRNDGVPTYKYKKTEQLFDALRLYYKLKDGGNI
jgi:hypothetical protein